MYNKEYSQREIECEVCECKVRKCNWARHVASRKHMLGGGGGKVVDDVGEGEDDTKGRHGLHTTVGNADFVRFGQFGHSPKKMFESQPVANNIK